MEMINASKREAADESLFLPLIRTNAYLGLDDLSADVIGEFSEKD